MHYGLLPRANRGIFAINELPDLAGKIQVGLFNILQEGDVQIKGYPVRLPLDILLVFTANPEDYTARGKIITPLKDRIGTEIRTHYPRRAKAMAITEQEAWLTRNGASRAPRCRPSSPKSSRRSRFRPDRIDASTSDRASASGCRSRRSRTSCRMPSGARCVHGRDEAVARVTDIYAALPSITGKFEMEYEGELKGAETRRARADPRGGRQRRRRLSGASRDASGHRVVRSGRQPAAGRHDDADGRARARARRCRASRARPRRRHPAQASAPLLAVGRRFRARGLYATKKISRSEERGYHGSRAGVRRPARERRIRRRTEDADGWRAEEEIQLRFVVARGSGAGGPAGGRSPK